MRKTLKNTQKLIEGMDSDIPSLQRGSVAGANLRDKTSLGELGMSESTPLIDFCVFLDVLRIVQPLRPVCGNPLLQPHWRWLVGSKPPRNLSVLVEDSVGRLGDLGRGVE